MFARKLRLSLVSGGSETPVPKNWLDQFFMRNFTGLRTFDETLAAGDGRLETSFGVPAEEVRLQFEKWLRGRKMISPDTRLVVAPEPSAF